MAKRWTELRLPARAGLYLSSLLCVVLLVQSAQAWSVGSLSFSETKPIVTLIPRGTILPVRLDDTLSSTKSKPCQTVTATIMQDVFLPNGARIPKGSKVEGKILEVARGTAAQAARISIRFDTLHLSHEVVVIAVSLRAIAGFMEVLAAQTPTTGPGFGEVFRWLTTRQVGGDVVYGDGGPVTSAGNGAEVVGKSVRDGVVVRVRSNERLGCARRVDDNDRPQGLWLFSSDACGAYGLAHVRILHSGRTDPGGMVTFAADTGKLKIQSGAGMLLRIE